MILSGALARALSPELGSKQNKRHVAHSCSKNLQVHQKLPPRSASCTCSNEIYDAAVARRMPPPG